MQISILVLAICGFDTEIYGVVWGLYAPGIIDAWSHFSCKSDNHNSDKVVNRFEVQTSNYNDQRSKHKISLAARVNHARADFRNTSKAKSVLFGN